MRTLTVQVSFLLVQPIVEELSVLLKKAAPYQAAPRLTVAALLTGDEESAGLNRLLAVSSALSMAVQVVPVRPGSNLNFFSTELFRDTLPFNRY